ncbi:hypothetical protein GA0070609_0756 [Micromonospora echinaurantiaca]|uniref:Uncharacterized protein n=1 Tax=Micromonospora echinaurantiaca TaxID=47857 RepID=A0A1C5H0Z1_9ACTN|nr:hypothetical protein [Micromonospora echinaurantiaca]SCG39674.1 hypothetical protein GA0070609_0756 [Micromonospora echinaurantiaca]
MPQKMVHYVGGPADGLVQLVQEGQHPFVVSLNTDTDGYYVMEYQVAGRRIGSGDLELTSDDIIARWHQRSSAQDFMTGDTIIVKDTGARGTTFAPTTYVNDDGTTEEGWMVSIDSKLMFVAPDQIRVATPQELSDEELA